MKRVRQNACALNLRNKGWRAIKTGLNASYSRGLLAWEKARDSASPKKLHSWRKHVKELGYQLALLCKVWPEQIQAMRDQLDLLGEQLGDHHDLCMLRDAANTMGADERGSIDLESLNTLIDQRHAALIVEALALGAVFYAEKLSIFCRRLAIYWKNWRRNGKIAVPTAN